MFKRTLIVISVIVFIVVVPYFLGQIYEFPKGSQADKTPSWFWGALYIWVIALAYNILKEIYNYIKG